jgi:hypothetical protein
MNDTLTVAQARATARRMHEGGWQLTEIRAYLAERGQPRSWDTVKGWANPDWAARRLAAQREGRRRRWRQQHGALAFRVLDEHAKVETIRRLRDEGLKSTAIAGALRVFVGDELTRGQISYTLATGSYPKRTRRSD